MNKLTSELAKINQGCKSEVKALGDIFYCGQEIGTLDSKIYLCPSCQSKKQGIILGAKMMIEEIKRTSKEYFDREYYNDFPAEPFETLEKLNKELEE